MGIEVERSWVARRFRDLARKDISVASQQLCHPKYRRCFACLARAIKDGCAKRLTVMEVLPLQLFALHQQVSAKFFLLSHRRVTGDLAFFSDSEGYRLLSSAPLGLGQTF